LYNQIPRFRRQIAVEDDQTGDEFLRRPPVTPGGISLSDSKTAEALIENLETQFQSVTALLSWQLMRWLMCG